MKDSNINHLMYDLVSENKVLFMLLNTFDLMLNELVADCIKNNKRKLRKTLTNLN